VELIGEALRNINRLRCAFCSGWGHTWKQCVGYTELLDNLGRPKEGSLTYHVLLTMIEVQDRQMYSWNWTNHISIIADWEAGHAWTSDVDGGSGLRLGPDKLTREQAQQGDDWLCDHYMKWSELSGYSQGNLVPRLDRNWQKDLAAESSRIGVAPAGELAQVSHQVPPLNTRTAEANPVGLDPLFDQRDADAF
jgi:hypothetical protein